MMTIVIDGLLNGTGIRDKYESDYIKPETLGLRSDLISRLNTWLEQYAQEHFYGFSNINEIERLDKIGIEIAKEIKASLSDTKVIYYSNGLLKEIAF